MPGIRIDMTGVSTEGGSFAALEPGDYTATLVKVEQKIGKDSGQPYLEFEFDVENTNGRKLWRNYSLQPKALWGLKLDLTNAFGWEVPDGAFDLDTDELLGSKVTLAVTVKDHWKGEIDQSTGQVKKDNEILEVKPASSW
jgi:uncharacterized protein DUF669